MASITLTIADENVPRVMAEVGRYNAENGTMLTAPQWAKRILAREVLRDDIQTDAYNLMLQMDAALRAERTSRQAALEDTL